MKDAGLFILLAVVGVGAYLWLQQSSTGTAATGAPSWRNIIGTLPAELPYAEQQALLHPDRSVTASALQGAATGSVAGPYGAAFGAGAGALVGFFS